VKVASVCLVYNEAHYLPKHLKHMPDWIDEQVVLISAKPWYGEELPDDGSEALAKEAGATVLKFPWTNEVDQRNAGQDYLSDCDWVVNIEPDEFLSNESWEKLREFLETATADAYVIKQRVFWGQGMESDPAEDFVPIVITRPTVRFVDKRNVNTRWEYLPDEIGKLLHFAWARTDEEIWKKISHYSHAVDFDIKDWYENVWLARKTENVHPTTPESIPRLIKAILPPEIAELNPWPQ
jgi:hypothetical protein